MSDISTLKIVDIDGNEKTISTKLPWGRERKVLKIVGDLLTEIPADILGGGDKTPGAALLEFITTQAPERVTEIVAIILSCSNEDVDNKYDGDAVFAFIIPFISQYAEKWNMRLQQVPAGMIPGVNIPGAPIGETAAPEVPEAQPEGTATVGE
jgi:hypothetical protein